MNNEKLYTQNDLDIQLLRLKNDHTNDRFDNIYNVLDKIESQQRWLLGLMGAGFLGLLSLMAHGFHWITW